MSFVILIESGCILYNDRCLHFTNRIYVYVCFNGTKAGHARTTNFSNYSLLQLPTSFSNTILIYFWVFWHIFCILTGRQPPMLPLMEDIATRWEGLFHCLAHSYTTHFQHIINNSHKFSLVGRVSWIALQNVVCNLP